MRTRFTALAAFAALALAAPAPRDARAGGPYDVRNYTVSHGPTTYVGPALLTPGWPYAPLAQIPITDVTPPLFGPKPYVGYGANDIFPYYGRSLLHPSAPWSWSALSQSRPGLYYYAPVR